MATEEIQISQLELAQEVQGDMVFAVDTATDTKSLSVNQLKNHISQPLQANINAVDTSALHKYNISNCITEIPQDIKLELNNGTLTLKAGSKVYLPNGFTGTTPKFDTVTIASDVSITRTDSQKCMAWYNMNTGTMTIFPKVLFYSGTSAPTEYTFMFWYDTTNNKCKVTSDNGSTWREGNSFPLCIASTDGTKISSIDQVFNGFGYIGSTVFALPGVKGLIPIGRNADGSLKNIEYNRTAVRVDTFGVKTYTGLFNLYSSQSINRFQQSQNYDEKTNIMTGSYGWSFISGVGYITNGVITSFTPKTAFHAVDYNDFEKAMLKEDWVRVSTPPASPDANKFYYIPEN